MRYFTLGSYEKVEQHI